MGDRAPPAKPAAKKAAAVKADVKKAQKAEAAKEKAKSDKTVAKAEAKLKKVEQKIATDKSIPEANKASAKAKAEAAALDGNEAPKKVPTLGCVCETAAETAQRVKQAKVNKMAKRMGMDPKAKKAADKKKKEAAEGAKSTQSASNASVTADPTGSMPVNTVKAYVDLTKGNATKVVPKKVAPMPATGSPEAAHLAANVAVANTRGVPKGTTMESAQKAYDADLAKSKANKKNKKASAARVVAAMEKKGILNPPKAKPAKRETVEEKIAAAKAKKEKEEAKRENKAVKDDMKTEVEEATKRANEKNARRLKKIQARIAASEAAAAIKRGEDAAAYIKQIEAAVTAVAGKKG